MHFIEGAVKPYDVSTVKNALVMPVCCVTEYSFYSLAVPSSVSKRLQRADISDNGILDKFRSVP